MAFKTKLLISALSFDFFCLLNKTALRSPAPIRLVDEKNVVAPRNNKIQEIVYGLKLSQINLCFLFQILEFFKSTNKFCEQKCHF